MGRNRDYDEAAVLAGAMQAFRRRGHDGASIRDLETATGLKAGSIYNSFGDKDGLFAAAFAHYNRTVLQGRIDRFAPPGRGLAGLRALFLSLLAEPDGGTFGCLITNSAVELGGRGAAHPGVEDGLRLLEAMFHDRLAVAGQTDPALGAIRLLVLYQGILVLIRAGRAPAALETLITREFQALEEAA
jgi:AcrR family transcriptional regulator